MQGSCLDRPINDFSPPADVWPLLSPCKVASRGKYPGQLQLASSMFCNHSVSLARGRDTLLTNLHNAAVTAAFLATLLRRFFRTDNIIVNF